MNPTPNTFNASDTHSLANETGTTHASPSTYSLAEEISETVSLALEHLFERPVSERDDLHALTSLSRARVRLESLGLASPHTRAAQSISLEIIQDYVAGMSTDTKVLGLRVPVNVEVPELGVRVGTIVNRVDLAEDGKSASLILYGFNDRSDSVSSWTRDPQLLTLIAACESILGRPAVELQRHLLLQRRAQTIEFDTSDSGCALALLAEFIEAVGDDQEVFAESGLRVSPFERAGDSA